MHSTTGGRWRCLACGATSETHAVVCGNCFSEGQLFPLMKRPGAAIDSIAAIASARDVLSSTWKMTEVRPYGFKLGMRSLVLLSGPPGSGKTTMALTAADGISGPCIVVSSELGLGPALASLLARCSIKRDDVLICDGALSVDALVRLALEKKARSVVVDSLQESWMSGRDLRHVIGLLPELVALFATSQVNRFGSPAGERAVEHESDVWVRVDELRWTLAKNRFGPTTFSGAVMREEEPHAAAE